MKANEAVGKEAGDELSRVFGGTQTPPRMQIVACRGTGEVEISSLHLRKSCLGFFYSLNAPMSGAGVRSTEASASTAGWASRSAAREIRVLWAAIFR